MRLIVREEAARDIEEIFQFIAKDDRKAARAVVLVVLGRMKALARTGFVNIGRQGAFRERENLSKHRTSSSTRLVVNPKPSNSADNKILRDALAIAVLKAASLGARDPLTLAMFAVATGFGAARHTTTFGTAHLSG
jgi:plasmid stabilization system protein ParE